MTRPLIKIILEAYLSEQIPGTYSYNTAELPPQQPSQPLGSSMTAGASGTYEQPPNTQWQPRQELRLISPEQVAQSVLTIVRPSVVKMIGQLEKEIMTKRPDFSTMVKNATGKFKDWWGRLFGRRTESVEAYNIISKYAKTVINETIQTQQPYPLTAALMQKRQQGKSGQQYLTTPQGLVPPGTTPQIWHPSPHSVQDSLHLFADEIEQLIYKAIVQEVKRYTEWMQGPKFAQYVSALEKKIWQKDAKIRYYQQQLKQKAAEGSKQGVENLGGETPPETQPETQPEPAEPQNLMPDEPASDEPAPEEPAPEEPAPEEPAPEEPAPEEPAPEEPKSPEELKKKKEEEKKKHPLGDLDIPDF